MACTWEVTSQVRYPSPDPEEVVASAPAVWGWLAQVTPFSDQFELTRMACMVRPPAPEGRYSRSVADSTTQPAGRAGRANRTRARMLFAGPKESTLSLESLPWLTDGLP